MVHKVGEVFVLDIWEEPEAYEHVCHQVQKEDSTHFRGPQEGLITELHRI